MKNYIFILVTCLSLNSFGSFKNEILQEKMKQKRLELLEKLSSISCQNSDIKFPQQIEIIHAYLKRHKEINMVSCLLYEQNIDNYVNGLRQRKTG